MSYEILSKTPDIAKYILHPVFHDTDNYRFIAFEYICLPTLDKLITDPTFVRSSFPRISQQLLEITDALYHSQIIYRDFKADNIFITKTNDILLIDFMFSISNNKSLNFQEIQKAEPIRSIILKNMGANSQKQPYVWDDAYGLLSIFNKHGLTTVDSIAYFIAELKQRVGRLEYKIDD